MSKALYSFTNQVILGLFLNNVHDQHRCMIFFQLNLISLITWIRINSYTLTYRKEMGTVS